MNIFLNQICLTVKEDSLGGESFFYCSSRFFLVIKQCKPCVKKLHLFGTRLCTVVNKTLLI